MNEGMIRVGQQMLNLAYVTEAHWEKRKLFIHLHGGAFTSVEGEDADLVWNAMELISVDLRAAQQAA